MKLIKLKKKYNLIELYLLKYQSSLKYIFPSNYNVELQLKYALKIIYSFHFSRKKIWFIGFPYFLAPGVSSTLGNCRHFFLPKITWVRGLIGNKKFVKNDFRVKDINDKSVFKQPDLLVVFNLDLKTSETLKEFYKLDTPIIIFGINGKGLVPSKFLNFVPINTNENKIILLCSFLIHSVLKTPDVSHFKHGSSKKK